MTDADPQREGDRVTEMVRELQVTVPKLFVQNNESTINQSRPVHVEELRSGKNIHDTRLKCFFAIFKLGIYSIFTLHL